MFEMVDWNTVISLAVEKKGKPAVYVSNHVDYDDPKQLKVWDYIVAQVKAVYPNQKDHMNLLSALIHNEVIFFDTEEDQHTFYNIFESGVAYAGPVYACTFDATGTCQSENT